MIAVVLLINNPSLLATPVVIAGATISFLDSRRRKRGLAPQEWQKFASIALLVALCFIVIFADFKR